MEYGLDGHTPIALDGEGAGVASGSTGRFAYASTKAGTAHWLDFTPNKKLGLPRSGILEDADASGALIATPDGSRLYAVDGSALNIFDLRRRKAIDSSVDPNVPISLPATAWDLDMTLSGSTIAASCPAGDSGTLFLLNSKLKDPLQFDPPVSENTSLGEKNLQGRLRGVAIQPDAKRAYVATAGKGDGYLADYWDPLHVINLQGGETTEINTTVPLPPNLPAWRRYSWIVHQEVYFSYLLVSPYILSDITGIATPPYVRMDVIDTSPYELWPIVAVYSPILFPVVGSTPCMFVVTFSVDPVGLYQGTDVEVPTATYPAIGPVALPAFDMTGNIAAAKRETNEIFAATTNQLGMLQIGSKYYPLDKIDASQVGDIAGQIRIRLLPDTPQEQKVKPSDYAQHIGAKSQAVSPQDPDQTHQA